MSKGLTDRDLKIKVLQQIWGFASTFCEGIERGELSDFYISEVEIGNLTENEAFRAQKIMEYEADLIYRKLKRVKNG